eukprot:CAMPEP_0204326714 /NCGR_PEP_ID=MMETSP0469-20131031/12037_1 /ASSEMBLY_ACC=CAM_ASM_000384 /TAXON_ID=2969 /ORGANISM="Oxyrrhis marina" /LENGTH=92 /DNA_ID=CAMNT_0051308817 /DNA_START=98 /DNA_END=373 /DNA_ORIENTATION=-
MSDRVLCNGRSAPMSRPSAHPPRAAPRATLPLGSADPLGPGRVWRVGRGRRAAARPAAPANAASSLGSLARGAQHGTRPQSGPPAGPKRETA